MRLVVENRLSVARFGDSEYLYMTGGSDGLQNANQKLHAGLLRAIQNKNKNLMVCLVDYEDLSNKTLRAKMSAKMFHSRTITGYYKYLDKNKIYGNSNMTRFYIGITDKRKSAALFDQCKLFWQDRNVILFEGENTRFGYGNDLFDNAQSVSRVLCPSKGAFDVYDKILACAKQQDKNSLLIFALGASATVAASDLTDHGYQVVDIGNLDTEYEWFRMGAMNPIAIKNKQVSEVAGGTNEIAIIDDRKYIDQIINIIK